MSIVLALISLGLLLSLLPRTSFNSRSADEIIDAVGPVWPEQSVEQVLDPGLRVVSDVRIWAAAGLGRGEAPVVAALLRGPDRDLVRQATVKVQASKLLQPYLIAFAPYHPASDEALTLQLWVSDKRDNHAIFGTVEIDDQGEGPTINQNPTDLGPLAYETIWRGDGWRAALEGSWLDRLRMALGLLASVGAILLTPTVARRLPRLLKKSKDASTTVVHEVYKAIRTDRTLYAARRKGDGAKTGRQTIYLFPWLIPLFAILHYIGANLILIRAYESIMLGLVITMIATMVYLAFIALLRDAASAAVLSGAFGIAFFSYGHLYADRDPPDDRFLLGIAIPLLVGSAILFRHRPGIARPIARTMNLASVILIVLAVYQIGQVLFTGRIQQEPDELYLRDFAGIEEEITEFRASAGPTSVPDIYFIILDEYPRHASPESFDNSEFVEGLERRGFYVDPHARSNYTTSSWSISSTLNMTYTDDYIPYAKTQERLYQIYNAAIDHNLGRIVTALGYKYVHVSSSWYLTESNPRADTVVSFGPRGRITFGSQVEDPCVIERVLSLSNRFTDGFLETTAASRVWTSDPRPQKHPCTYHWSHPDQTLEAIEFIKSSAEISGPKFVFAHLIKPHGPYSFDQHGNISPLPQGWDDEHDPTVPGAFYGQLIWLNGRLLEVIDEVLKGYDNPPIMVIMGDHGFERDDTSTIANDILAAYLLPNDGEDALYPGITSVNAFRAILNWYFDLDLEILRDRVRHP